MGSAFGTVQGVVFASHPLQSLEAFGQRSEAQGGIVGVSVHGQELDWIILMGSFQASAFCDSVKSSSCSSCSVPRAGAALLLQGTVPRPVPISCPHQPHPAPEAAQQDQLPMDEGGSGCAGPWGSPCLAAGRCLSTRTVPSLGTRSLKLCPGLVTLPNGRFRGEEAAFTPGQALGDRIIMDCDGSPGSAGPVAGEGLVSSGAFLGSNPGEGCCRHQLLLHVPSPCWPHKLLALWSHPNGHRVGTCPQSGGCWWWCSWGGDGSGQSRTQVGHSRLQWEKLGDVTKHLGWCSGVSGAW